MAPVAQAEFALAIRPSLPSCANDVDDQDEQTSDIAHEQQAQRSRARGTRPSPSSRSRSPRVRAVVSVAAGASRPAGMAFSTPPMTICTARRLAEGARHAENDRGHAGAGRALLRTTCRDRLPAGAAQGVGALAVLVRARPPGRRWRASSPLGRIITASTMPPERMPAPVPAASLARNRTHRRVDHREADEAIDDAGGCPRRSSTSGWKTLRPKTGLTSTTKISPSPGPREARRSLPRERDARTIPR